MDVQVRNVAPESTQNGLRRFLRPHFEKLSIRAVSCQKQRGKTVAYLTFLHLSEGQRFLANHGQEWLPAGARRPRHNPQSSKATDLVFHNKPIYCSKAHWEANPYHLRVLTKEENERQTKALAATTTMAVYDNGLESLSISFDCSSVSCGVWSYSNSDLVFAPQLNWNSKGTAKFGERAMILTFSDGSKRRIDFRYTGTLAIKVEDGAIIFSMAEPPHFYETIINPLAQLMAGLGISSQNNTLQRRTGPNRHRIPSLDDDHKAIAGSCLVYRIGLNINNKSTDHDLIQLLSRARGLPHVVHRRTRIVHWPEPYVVGLRRLQNILASTAINLPFAVAFQVQKLVQNAYLPPHIVADMIPAIQDMIKRATIPVCVRAMKKLFHKIPFPGLDIEATEFHLDTLVDQLKASEELCKREGSSLDDVKKSDNVAIIHRAKVTPAGILLYGPEPETTNRVLRKYHKYHDYFLRVQFCEEDGMPVRFNPQISNEQIYHGKFKAVLLRGIKIADRTYEFLGFSHSSLRAQTCWFVAPFIHNGVLVSDRMIIRELGEFEAIRSPAKCAARIGQTFSDTPVTVQIDPSILKMDSDVEFGNRIFSDGVGTMSTSVMHKIWKRLPKASRATPTCFQIRYAGAKGMISLDSRLEGDALILRPSMIKFDGSNKIDIEICESAYRPLPAFLNRQFIKILEDMGVPDSFFLDLQAKEIDRIRTITNSPINASSFLKRQSVGDAFQLPWLIIKLASMKLNFQFDGFLRNVLEITILMELRMLKHKTRIPVEDGYHLHGIMDETGLLDEGQIYCTVRVDGVNTTVVGKNLIISRAPALHPGDVQVVEGVTVPITSPLAKLANCIVFSQKGSRDLPSQLSGGDLDGDRYYIIWDKACRPKHTFRPADYPRQDPVDIGRIVAAEDMTDFFIQFMITDQLGRIAVLHRILSDQKVDGTLDPSCITLAEMHSTAVDFSKTGIPVDMSKMPKYNPWRPDFEAPGPYVTICKNEGIDFEDTTNRDPDPIGDDDEDFTTYRYYESHKILGKLYRAINEREIFEEIKQRAQATESTQTATLIHAVWKYEESLQNTMLEYSEHPLRPLSELEVFVGNILGRTGAQSKRQRELSTSLKEAFDRDSTFFVNSIVKDGEEWSEEALERSIACLAVSLEVKSSLEVKRGGVHLLSFKYVAAAVCLREVERMTNY